MTKEEIMEAMWFMANGRRNHPAAERLAEELAKVFAQKPERKKAEKAE